VDAEGARLVLGEQALELPAHLRSPIARWRGRSVVVGIRPEDLSDAALAERDDSAAHLEGAVDLVESLGAEKLIHFRIDASRLQSSDARLSTDEDLDMSAGEIGQAASTAGVARVPPASRIESSQRAVFLVAIEHLHLFDPDSGDAIDAGARERVSEGASQPPGLKRS
jgi:multiple sugar transport system ATP-binding protein